MKKTIGWNPSQTISGIITQENIEKIQFLISEYNNNESVFSEEEKCLQGSPESNEDGHKKDHIGIRYERNPVLRRKAIAIHGTVCFACDFDFKQIYGEHGNGFVEIHHVKPLFEVGKAHIVDPKNDLIPLCSNCHRMVHRRKNRIIPWQELKDIIKKHKISDDVIS